MNREQQKADKTTPPRNAGAYRTESRLAWPWRALGLYGRENRPPNELSPIEKLWALADLVARTVVTAYLAGGFVAGIILWNRPTSDVLGDLFSRVIYAVMMGVQSAFLLGFPYSEGSLFDFQSGPDKPVSAWPYIAFCLIPSLLFWLYRRRAPN